MTFSLGGSQRGDTNSVTVALGTEFQETFTLPSAAPLALITRTIAVPASTTAQLSFDHAGGDNVGLILDAVRLSRQAEPTETTSVSYQYDAASRRTSVTLPNGTQTTYTYDPASKVTNILHKIVTSAAQINKADYVYNTVGKRTGLTDRRGVQNFGYDALDRLTSATHPLTFDQAFSYDPVGNRTTNSSVYNVGNQLTEDANFTYSYDLNGNLTRKTFKSNSNHTDYTYDAENRLVSVDGGATAQYRYDHQNRRVTKIIGGAWTHYIWEGSRVIGEHDGTTPFGGYGSTPYGERSSQIDYIYAGSKLVSSLSYTHSCHYDGAAIICTTATTTRYYLSDRLSTRLVLDASGNVIGRQGHLPFGEDFAESGSQEKHHFTSYERDLESGTDYAGNRQYSH